jgi:hypothetical protein
MSQIWIYNEDMVVGLADYGTEGLAQLGDGRTLGTLDDRMLHRTWFQISNVIIL